ncbi:MAG: transketolase [archaeon]|nr:transketolase [archaeon]
MDFNIEKLKERAKQVRRDTLKLAGENNGYHLGGSFSATDIMIALYDIVLKKEDKFILSKGHACFPLYVLLRDQGYNPKISGHPSIDLENGISCTTGSLGHGLPIGTGMALAKKCKKQEGKIYVLLGDGECQEGTTWESALIASHHELDNLIAIVDYNKIQGSGKVKNILKMNGLEGMFRANNWNVIKINGHDYSQIIPALRNKRYQQPKVIIADTIKGKGVSYMEDKPEWHSRFPNPEQLKQAYEELK